MLLAPTVLGLHCACVCQPRCKTQVLAAHVPEASMDLSGKQLTVCIDSQCESGSIGPFVPSSRPEFVLGGCIDVALVDQSSGTTFLLTPLAMAGCPPASLSAGEQIDLMIVSVDGAVEYAKSYTIAPQHDGCDSTCKQLQLEF